ncbi:ef hand domain-containing protein [Cystoisospora suis]|uniref:Ef hand domain-containing protein n=1 Tax=Cystoisospora suis TaxID=483139 RepID=A0A2C6LBW1_9APIC|nr:ef hand domain-containing protein [Cystoisospora suis]
MFLLRGFLLVIVIFLLPASPDHSCAAAAAPSRQPSQSQPGGAQQQQSGKKLSPAAKAQTSRSQAAQQKPGGPAPAAAASPEADRTAQDDKDTIRSVGRQLDNDEEDFLREEFAEYDTNGDGMLDAYEVRITHPEIANNELFSFFTSVDLNQDGLLTLSEYREYIESTM